MPGELVPPPGRTRRFTLITFDLDDTLWELRPVLQRAELEVATWMAEHCPEVGQRFDQQALMQLRLQVWHEMPELRYSVSAIRIESLRRAFRACDHDEERSRALAETAFAVFTRWRHVIEPFPGVEPVLSRLEREYILGALTNGNADVFRLAIGRHFHFAFTAEQLRASKPAAAHFEAALATAGVDASQALHIGDHDEHDVAGAKAVGMTAVWFNPAGRPWDGSTRPDAEIRDIAELPELITRLERS